MKECADEEMKNCLGGDPILYQAKSAENSVQRGGRVSKNQSCWKWPEMHFGFGILKSEKFRNHTNAQTDAIVTR